MPTPFLRQPPFGATPIENGAVAFHVWAPFAKEIKVKLIGQGLPIQVPMTATERHCFKAEVPAIPAGARYFYQIDGDKDRPDPYSRFQPEGVHGPSEVVDPKAFAWSDGTWRGIPLEAYIFYELHPGTFTPEGTFEAIIPHLTYLQQDLGISAIEIMPIAQFPGRRNWGYDGVHLFAPQNSYGGPEGLKRLVDACHTAGLAVVLDVVYNHLGHEGNYLREFGPYFTSKYKTPWGDAVNYDDAGSDFVRRYVIDNALYWIREYHIDALRLDAVHAIYDFSAKHILQALKEAVEEAARELGRPAYLIAESDLNDPKIIRSPHQGGDGLDAQWSDDFHHCLHTLLTGEQAGYYQDFGRLDRMEQAIREGFVIAGDYSPYRDRIHGSPSAGLPPSQFVVFAQNHDQVGNRIWGDRLSTLVSFEAQKLAAAVVLLSPNLPLLFMGEEYGETAPFQYFTDYQDPGLGEAVRKGRWEEAIRFGWKGEVPDPQSEETFQQSKLDLTRRVQESHRRLFSFYQRLLSLRKSEPSLSSGGGWPSVKRPDPERCLTIQRGDTWWMILSFNPEPLSLPLSLPHGKWERLLDSQEKPFGGLEERVLPLRIEGEKPLKLRLSPYQVALFRRIG
ncbi:MAG: malto-oligosyltrehalose trehalohydrolase [Candidatus Manganitrophaceae bacterium]|nr:MAG: malto-oligosyltrehalose trehalohydrolase [Candidatus Manganitrophaceae bacterium]